MNSKSDQKELIEYLKSFNQEEDIKSDHYHLSLVLPENIQKCYFTLQLVLNKNTKQPVVNVRYLDLKYLAKTPQKFSANPVVSITDNHKKVYSISNKLKYHYRYDYGVTFNLNKQTSLDINIVGDFSKTKINFGMSCEPLDQTKAEIQKFYFTEIIYQDDHSEGILTSAGMLDADNHFMTNEKFVNDQTKK
jgi:hypothetical protein